MSCSTVETLKTIGGPKCVPMLGSPKPKAISLHNQDNVKTARDNFYIQKKKALEVADLIQDPIAKKKEYARINKIRFGYWVN